MSLESWEGSFPSGILSHNGAPPVIKININILAAKGKLILEQALYASAFCLDNVTDVAITDDKLYPIEKNIDKKYT